MRYTGLRGVVAGKTERCVEIGLPSYLGNSKSLGVRGDVTQAGHRDTDSDRKGSVERCGDA
jgi:hypothetical protein